MASVFIRHRVRDYDVWKAVFDEGVDARREQGVLAHSVHRDAADPNLVIIALRVQDLAIMRERAQSQNLQDTMVRGGIEGTPGLVQRGRRGEALLERGRRRYAGLKAPSTHETGLLDGAAKGCHVAAVACQRPPLLAMERG